MKLLYKVRPQKKQRRLKSALTVANPQYLQNEKMGFSNFKTPRHLYFYKEFGADLVVPSGILKKLVSLYNCDVVDKREIGKNGL